MSRRKAPSLIEIRTADGLLVTIENPPEELLRAILAVIGQHARPDAAKARPRPRIVETPGPHPSGAAQWTQQEGNPL